MTLDLKVQSFIQKQKLCRKGDRIIVGVSGGADSICLLTILNHLKHKLGISLIVAHFNHQLRRDSKQDQQYVAKYAARFNLPFITTDCKKNLKQMKGSLENLARQERLKFFQHLSTKYKTNLIALAHTQDDLAETVLMRMIRGSGLYGLRAIMPERTIDGMRLIRPLLEIHKNEILKYLKTHSIKFREDSTNQKTIYFRNLIRLELLPLLKKRYNPNIVGTLTGFAYQSSKDYSYLEAQAESAFHRIKKNISATETRIDLKKLIRLHPALQHMILRLAVSELAGNIGNLETRHIEEIDDLIFNRPNQSIVHLPEGLQIKKSNQNLLLTIN